MKESRNTMSTDLQKVTCPFEYKHHSTNTRRHKSLEMQILVSQGLSYLQKSSLKDCLQSDSDSWKSEGQTSLHHLEYFQDPRG